MKTGGALEYSAKRLRPYIVVGAFILLTGAVWLPCNASPARPVTKSSPTPMIYAADCTTPQSTFNLGETVCVKVVGLTGFRLQWVNPDGFAVAMKDVTSSPQSDTFLLPSTDQSTISGFFTANNLGRWRVNAVTSRNSATSSVFFTVRNPNSPKVDLSIVTSLIGSATPVSGDQIQFFVTIVNNGPDDAVNAHFVDNVFSNAIFNSITQTSGPMFTCSGADCHISSLSNGAAATFILNFTAGSAFGVLDNTATISSDTPELNPSDNVSASAPITIGTTGPLPTCNLVVTAPPAVTLFTGPAATSCGVAVNNLDVTLGTGSATDNCPLAGPVVRAGVPLGSVFPVGVTILTYSVQDTDGNGASAIQQVTVVDNTPPAVTCPSNITLEPTCPSGAVASWTAPIGSDNCPPVASVLTAGLSSGSVFPIGTTPVAYAVTDAAGNQASCSFTVTVLTAGAAIQNLEASISSSSLKGPQKQGLLPKLDAALNALNRGNTTPVCQVLPAFINLVQNYISLGQISAAQGQAWINSATHVVNAIGCTGNACT